MSGLAFPESPRWRDGRLWVSDWGAGEVIAARLDGQHRGRRAVGVLPDVHRPSARWPPADRGLQRAADLRREGDGALVTHADLSDLGEHPWNDIVVDGEATPMSTTSASTSPTGSSRPERSPWHARRLRAACSGRPRLPKRHGRDTRQRDADRRRVLRQQADRLRDRSGRHPDQPPDVGGGRGSPRWDLPRCRWRHLVRRCRLQTRCARPRGRRGTERGRRSIGVASPACSAGPIGERCSWSPTSGAMLRHRAMRRAGARSSSFLPPRTESAGRRSATT